MGREEKSRGREGKDSGACMACFDHINMRYEMRRHIDS